MYDMKALYQAESVQDAVALRVAHPDAQIIAGGSDVLVQMREGKRAGVELISIYGLDELRGVTLEADGTLRIFPHYPGSPDPEIPPCFGRGRGPGGRSPDPQHRHHRR